MTETSRPSKTAGVAIAIRLTGLILLLILLALLLGVWPEIVRTAGVNIPTEDPIDDYLIGMRTAALLSVFLWMIPFSPPVKNALFGVWSAKILVTLGVMIFYEQHYDILDCYVYFLSAERGPDWEVLEWGQGAEIMVFLTWIADSLFGRSFHSAKVLFSFVGLFGVWAVGKAATLFMNEEASGRYILLAGLYPSILFWSSILGKDPIVFCGIGLFTFGVAKLVRNKNVWSSIALIVVGVSLASAIRIWLGVILLTPTGYILLRGRRSVVYQVALSVLLILFLRFFSDEFFDHFNVETESDLFEYAENISQAWATGGSAQQADISIGAWTDFLTWAPMGAFSALFRPFPGELPGAFGLIAGLENIPLYFFCILAAARLRRKDFHDSLVVWCLLVVGFWSIIYGLVSFQNLGAAVRFRLQVLPLLLGVTMYLGRSKHRTNALRTTEFGMSIRPKP